MTKEDKELLLKDLCSRLPYGFTVHRFSDNRDITIECDDIDMFAHFLEYSEGEDFMPYLRSMYSMTEEEEFALDETRCYTQLTLESYDWLNKHHFDYRHLIEKGLALEAPEGMYNI